MCRLSKSLAIIVAAICAATLLLVGQALGQTSRNAAGLVVVHDDGRLSYSLVEFSEESLSGADLLDRSGLKVTEVTFGGLGIGVCSIDETGCDVSVCRQRVCQGTGPDDPYWQYFLANPDGSWSSSALGVSADTVKPGNVRAFIWSANEPDFAAPDIESVRSRAMVGNQVSDSTWLTRYAADGSVLGDPDPDERSFPLAALGLVAAAAIGVIAMVARGSLARKTR